MCPNCIDVFSFKEAPVDFDLYKGASAQLAIDFIDEIFCYSRLPDANAWLKFPRLSLTTNGRGDVTAHSTQTTLWAVVQEDAPPKLENVLRRSGVIWDHHQTFESWSIQGT